MTQKIGVTLEKESVAELDRWVREGKYANRSRALQSAVDLLSEREKRRRLTREVSKLSKREEQRMAEEGLGAVSWPGNRRTARADLVNDLSAGSAARR